VSTVSIGSNRKYAENWDTIFKGGKTTKRSTATGKTKIVKATTAKKKVKSHKPARKAGKQKG
jgi:hypothetical protein